MQEDLHPLVYAVNYVRTKEGITREILFLLPLEAVNVFRPYVHGLYEGTFSAQVVPRNPQKFPHSVPELLCGGYHTDQLVQKIPSLFLGKAVLSRH